MDDKNDDSDYFGYEGAHRLTGIRKGTLYALVAGRRIPHKRLGPRHVLFARSELLEWLDEHSVPQTTARSEKAEKKKQQERG